jgi:hypothetical protein
VFLFMGVNIYACVSTRGCYHVANDAKADIVLAAVGLHFVAAGQSRNALVDVEATNSAPLALAKVRVGSF